MKRRLAFSFTLLLSLGLWLAGSSVGLILIVILAALSIFSWVLGLIGGSKLESVMELPGTADRGESFAVRIGVRSSSPLPLGPVRCRVEAENTLTRECTSFILWVTPTAKGEAWAEGKLSSNHCGHLAVRVTQLRPMDWFGILPGISKRGGNGAVTVLPTLMEAHVDLDVPAASPDDSSEYAPDRIGTDYSETYQLREYRDGDSLRAVHWKLTGKLDRLVVRDPGYPIAKSTLVYWDRSSGNPSVQELDTMGDIAASLCHGISEQGMTYTLGWNEGGLVSLEEIDDEDSLLRAIPSMLRGPGEEGNHGGASLLRCLGGRVFGRIICIAAAVPEELAPLGESLWAIVLRKDPPAFGNVTVINTDNLEDQLLRLEMSLE